MLAVKMKVIIMAFKYSVFNMLLSEQFIVSEQIHLQPVNKQVELLMKIQKC